MSSLLPCASCQCFIHGDEATCPFCSAAIPAAPAPRRAAVPGRNTTTASLRTSRARWLAGSSLVLLACDAGMASSQNSTTEGPSSATASDTSSTSTTTATASTSVGSSVGASTGGEAFDGSPIGVFLTAGQGSFTCPSPPIPYQGGGTPPTCDRATEWCFTNHGFVYTGCVPFATGCIPGDAGAGYGGRCYDIWDRSQCDGGLPRCACVAQSLNPTCFDDDAGGVTFSVGSCYGAPPPRRRVTSPVS